MAEKKQCGECTFFDQCKEEYGVRRNSNGNSCEWYSTGEEGAEKPQDATDAEPPSTDEEADASASSDDKVIPSGPEEEESTVEDATAVETVETGDTYDEGLVGKEFNLGVSVFSFSSPAVVQVMSDEDRFRLHLYDRNLSDFNEFRASRAGEGKKRIVLLDSDNLWHFLAKAEIEGISGIALFGDPEIANALTIVEPDAQKHPANMVDGSFDVAVVGRYHIMGLTPEIVNNALAQVGTLLVTDELKALLLQGTPPVRQAVSPEALNVPMKELVDSIEANTKTKLEEFPWWAVAHAVGCTDSRSWASTKRDALKRGAKPDTIKTFEQWCKTEMCLSLWRAYYMMATHGATAEDAILRHPCKREDLDYVCQIIPPGDYDFQYTPDQV